MAAAAGVGPQRQSAYGRYQPYSLGGGARCGVQTAEMQFGAVWALCCLVVAVQECRGCVWPVDMPGQPAFLLRILFDRQ
jgi:hypothetical protein